MPRVKQFDKQEVLEKAMTLFWQKGYHDTSIQDLVDNLHINRGSLYDTFGGKKNLFESAFEKYRISNIEGLTNYLSTQNNVKEGLRRVFQKVTFDDYTDEELKGCFIVNSTTELLPNEIEFQSVVESHKRNMENIFYDFLKRGVDSGQIPESKDIKTLSQLIYTVMVGLRVLGKTKPEIKESMASVEFVLRLLD